MLDAEKLDAVIIATPWQFHHQQAIDSMKAGVYVGCEVIAGLTLEEHWDLVKTSESTGIPYMCLENVAYRRDVMAVLNMVRSEEHTSELQSLMRNSYAVFCLKTKHKQISQYRN